METIGGIDDGEGDGGEEFHNEDPDITKSEVEGGNTGDSGSTNPSGDGEDGLNEPETIDGGNGGINEEADNEFA